MEQDKKNVIKFIIIMTIYILLSALGVFNQMGTVLFPIVAIPFALYCMKNQLAVHLHVFFHVIVSMTLYLMMQSALVILIYMVSVVIPTYIILFLYKRELSLPNIIMYGGLILAGVIFGYFSLMKGIGLDFEAHFGASLDTFNTDFKAILDNVQKVSIEAGNSVEEVQTAVMQMKEVLDISIDLLKTLYPAVIVSQIVIWFAVAVVIINIRARRVNKSLPSTRQLLEFRISKFAVLLLVISMLIAEASGVSNEMVILALSLITFLTNLFEIVGALSLIALLKRIDTSTWLKTLGYIGIVLLFMLSPRLLMFYGCLDSIFNYRKVNIVV